jgi:hypothetical protein
MEFNIREINDIVIFDVTGLSRVFTITNDEETAIKNYTD